MPFPRPKSAQLPTAVLALNDGYLKKRAVSALRFSPVTHKRLKQPQSAYPGGRGGGRALIFKLGHL